MQFQRYLIGLVTMAYVPLHYIREIATIKIVFWLFFIKQNGNYSQLGTMRLAGYLSSHIQRVFVE